MFKQFEKYKNQTHSIAEDSQIVVKNDYHRTDEIGMVYFNRFDEETGRPYYLVAFKDGAIEVFWEGELELA